MSERPPFTILSGSPGMLAAIVEAPPKDVTTPEEVDLTVFAPRGDTDMLKWMRGLKKGDKIGVISPQSLYPAMAVAVKVWEEAPKPNAFPPGPMGDTPILPDFSKAKFPIVEIEGHCFFDRTGKPVPFNSTVDLQLAGTSFIPYTDVMGRTREKRDIITLLKEFDWNVLPLENLQDVVTAVRAGLGAS